MMSLVPVGSPDLIVTWGPVDVGSGAINESITYELKTEVSIPANNIYIYIYIYIYINILPYHCIDTHLSRIDISNIMI